MQYVIVSLLRMAIHVGIGSWGDDAYVGVIYPQGLPKSGRLREYAKSFSHVEVNSTYYAIPPPAAVAAWVKQTPENFTFSVKLHRGFAQSPTKAAEGPMIPRLLSAMKPLIEAKRLRAFLLVLPPRFGPDRHQLDELDSLTAKLDPIPLAVELRDRAWGTGAERTQTLNYFRERKLIWIAVDMPPIPGSAIMPAVDEATHPALAYLRLHGRNPKYLEAESAAEGHHYDYTPREITTLASRILKFSKKAEDTFVICNNHAEDFAPKAALALKAKIGDSI
jgi:uncharacterized protein YecE (DUF72 family)